VLPKIKQPSYSIYLHSKKKDVQYRPYTVGEEKILMMVSQSDDIKFINENIKTVIQGCILDPDINVNDLAAYDVENLLLKIRAKSSGEIAEIKYKDEVSNKEIDLKIDLEKLDVTFPENHHYKIEIAEGVGFIMKDLTFSKILSYQETLKDSSDEKKAEITYESILDCIDKIYDGDNVMTIGEETSREELEEFVSNLTGVSQKLYEFMETVPSIKYTFKIEDREIVIGDIRNFL
jgi:hypothetical protein